MNKEIAELVIDALAKIQSGVESKVDVPVDRDYLKPPSWTPPKSLSNLELTKDPFTKEELDTLLEAIDNAIETQTSLNQGMDIGVQVLKSLKKLLPLFL